MPTPKPPYPAAVRQRMVELVRADRGVTEMAREFGCNASSIHHWVNAASPDKAPGSTTAADAPLTAGERQELLELRHTLKQVQMERDILAKATARFAGKSEKTSTSSTKTAYSMVGLRIDNTGAGYANSAAASPGILSARAASRHLVLVTGPALKTPK